MKKLLKNFQIEIDKNCGFPVMSGWYCDKSSLVNFEDLFNAENIDDLKSLEIRYSGNAIRLYKNSHRINRNILYFHSNTDFLSRKQDGFISDFVYQIDREIESYFEHISDEEILLICHMPEGLNNFDSNKFWEEENYDV